MPLSRPLVLLVSLLLAACGRGSERAAERWVELARGFDPGPLGALAERLEGRVQPPRGSRFESGADGAEGGALFLELPLAPEQWSAGPAEREWRAPLPTRGAMWLAVRSSIVLVDEGRTWTQAPTRRSRAPAPESTFRVVDDELVLALASDAQPSPALRLRARLEHGRAASGRWRGTAPGFSCNGFLVFPGEPVTVACELPRASALGFGAVHAWADALEPPSAIRVDLDGRALGSVPAPERAPLEPSWHRIELDASGAHELTFVAEGSAPVLIAAPVVAPRELGAPGARPWGEPRPDLVLLVCDTFRADNLAEWGGDPELAPQSNHLARVRCASSTRARRRPGRCPRSARS